VLKKRKKSKQQVALSILTHPDVVMLVAMGFCWLDSMRKDQPELERLAATSMGMIYTLARPMLLEQWHSTQGN
jgi:hypothetical protein